MHRGERKMDYIYVNDKEALEALMKRNFEETNGNIIRKTIQIM